MNKFILSIFVLASCQGCFLNSQYMEARRERIAEKREQRQILRAERHKEKLELYKIKYGDKKQQPQIIINNSPTYNK